MTPLEQAEAELIRRQKEEELAAKPATAAPAQPAAVNDPLAQAEAELARRSAPDNRSFFQRVKDAMPVQPDEHIFSHPMEDLRKSGEQFSDIMRVGVDAAGVGAGDYLTDLQRGNTEQRQLTDEARERLGPVGSTVTDFGGSMLTPMGQFNKLRRGYQIGAHALQGGGQSLANEWTHGERDPGDLIKAFGVGSGITGTLSTISGGISDWAQRRRQAKNLPTDAEFKAGEKELYKKVEDAKAVYPKSETPKLMAELQNIKLYPGVDDAAIQFRDALQKDWANRDIPPEKLDQLRRIVRDKTKKLTDPKVGQQFVTAMDKFAANTDPVDRFGNPMPELNETLLDARSTHETRMRAKEVEKARPRRTGKNVVTKILNVGGEGSEAKSRTRFAKLRDKDASFRPNERERIAQLAEGTTLRDIGEFARYYSPMRNIPTALVGGGASLLSGVGALPSVLGTAGAEGLALLGKAKTQGEIDDLMALIKTGKPLEGDPKKVAEARALLARLASGGTRTGYDRFGGSR